MFQIPSTYRRTLLPPFPPLLLVPAGKFTGPSTLLLAPLGLFGSFGLLTPDAFATFSAFAAFLLAPLAVFAVAALAVFAVAVLAVFAVAVLAVFVVAVLAVPPPALLEPETLATLAVLVVYF